LVANAEWRATTWWWGCFVLLLSFVLLSSRRIRRTSFPRAEDLARALDCGFGLFCRRLRLASLRDTTFSTFFTIFFNWFFGLKFLLYETYTLFLATGYP
jgi:hypothetical protein